MIDAWAAIVASSLTWEQAHASVDGALRGLPAELRGRRAENVPYSIWELVEHIRLTQHDLLEFCVNPRYHEPKWPDDYWPGSQAPPSDEAWETSLTIIRREAQAFAKFTTDSAAMLNEKIPHGTGQTYLRTVLVAVDHTSHHVGQIILLRRLLGVWPPA